MTRAGPNKIFVSITALLPVNFKLAFALGVFKMSYIDTVVPSLICNSVLLMSRNKNVNKRKSR